MPEESSAVENEVTVVGAGLAGCECALQLARFGYRVKLIEMRKIQLTPAHKTQNYAELVCSNSFGSLNEISAPGQLKWEAEKLGSFLLKAAKDAAVPAGQALGVDRAVFSKIVTDAIESNPNICVEHRIVTSLNEIPRPAVLATGPLTDTLLAEDLKKHFGNEFCYFFDAIAPIIDADSIDESIVWRQDRYDKGTPDYLNCPFNKDQYWNFVRAIEGAEKITPKEFETTDFFEGCMPIEEMIERGPQTPRFGPMKPVGLKPPGAEREPYAVVQLRQENREGTAYNMVGFQTRMTYSEQVRVFRTIPGLEKAEFLKLGSIHRNLFINSPTMLNKNLSSKNDSNLFFAGQITGVEGYFESICMGLIAALFVNQHLKLRENPQTPAVEFHRTTALGSLMHAITDPDRAKHFQPTNINFGLFPRAEIETRDKAAKKKAQVDTARANFTIRPQ